MQISQDVKDHVIIFKDGSQKFITSKSATNLFELSASNIENFKLDGGTYSFRTIAKIISTEEYFRQYPEKSPTSYDSAPLPPFVPLTREKRIKALTAMLGGFVGYFDGREMPLQCQLIAKRIKQALDETKNSPQNVFNNPIREKFLPF